LRNEITNIFELRLKCKWSRMFG